MYGSSIVGAKLLITVKDKKALDCFFNNEDFAEDATMFRDLATRWKSTTELRNELDEPAKRTRMRLRKLRGLGLVEVVSIKAKTRADYYWYISHTGMYYRLSSLARPKLIRFLKSNEDKMREFGYIKELVAQNRPEASFLMGNLKKFVRDTQYHLMVPFVHDLIKRIFGNNAYYLPPYHPDIKDTIREIYGKERIKELEKTYGRILDKKGPKSQ